MEPSKSTPNAPPSPTGPRRAGRRRDITEEEDEISRPYTLRRLDTEYEFPADVDELNKVAQDTTATLEQRQEAFANLKELTKIRGQNQRRICHRRASEPCRAMISAHDAVAGEETLMHAGISTERLTFIKNYCPIILRMVTRSPMQPSYALTASDEQLMELARDQTQEVAVFFQPGGIQPQGFELNLDTHTVGDVDARVKYGVLHQEAELDARKGLKNLKALRVSEERLLLLAQHPFMLIAAKNKDEAAILAAMSDEELQEELEMHAGDEEAAVGTDDDEDGQIEGERAPAEDIDDETLEREMMPDEGDVARARAEDGPQESLELLYGVQARKEEEHVQNTTWSPTDTASIITLLQKHLGLSWAETLTMEKHTQRPDLYKDVFEFFKGKRTMKAIRAKVSRIVASSRA